MALRTHNPRPGILLGRSPESKAAPLGRLERWEEDLGRLLGRRSTLSFEYFQKRIRGIRSAAKALGRLNEDRFAEQVARLRIRLRTEAKLDVLRESAFAMVCVLCERHLGLVPHDEQLYGGWLILQGTVAEMATGEGKTLSCAFPAAAMALGGTPVHVVTVNDYLVERDAGQLAPIYRGLGLTIGAITEGSTPSQRKNAYDADVTYVSNKQLVFDYLRDRQTSQGAPNALRKRLEPLISLAEPTTMQRGLCFAIVDEADSVLIDDAKTPFILSRPMAEAGATTEYTVALGIARRLQSEEHFRLGSQGAKLTDAGVARLDELTSALPNRWRNPRFRKAVVQQALMALHHFVRDKHYVVKDGRVVLIDENTGRPVPDRSLSHGLHQMVQIKEKSTVTQPSATLARISYQRFFGRYLAMGGMTGTAWEVRHELRVVYGLSVRRVPTHQPRRVRHQGTVLFATMQEKYARLLQVVESLHSQGRPVLIGTRSVGESEQLQRVLKNVGYEVQVLNANQDLRESDIVASAGQRGKIMVATNMAGRGTDIPLGEGVAELGGLHVISAHLNDSSRIDRQLFGRCGRQGNPGSTESILSLQDDAFAEIFPDSLLRLFSALAEGQGFVWRLCAPRVAAFAQSIRSRQHRRTRAAVRRADEELESLLAFASSGE